MEQTNIYFESWPIDMSRKSYWTVQKMGFGVPIDKWLRNPLRDWAQERFEDKPIIDSLLLDQAIIRRLWRLHLSGNAMSTHCFGRF